MSLGSVIDFTLQYFNVFLIAVLIVLVTLVMSIFIKRKLTLILVMTLLVLGGFITVNLLTYTTFPELYEETLTEDSVIDSIKIRVHDPSSDELYKHASKAIEDPDIIERLMNDFSKIELKKEDHSPQDYYQYHVEIAVTNQVGTDHYLTKVLHVKLDEHFLDDYKIISNTNHLKTIQTLVGGKEGF